MGTTAQKIQKSLESKNALKVSINNKGGTITDDTPFSEYASQVDGLATPTYWDGSHVEIDGSYMFTLSTVTVDGVRGYKVTAYNGSDTEISIPEYNTDGLPILACASLAVPKITGLYIKSIDSFQNNTTITEINFPNISYGPYDMLYNKFSGCSNLTSVHALNTSNVERMDRMFYRCYKLESIPQFDTSKANDMSNMFYECSSLTTIPRLDTSNVTNMLHMFYNASKLKSILMYGMKVKFKINASTQFEREDLVTILNNLATVTEAQTLTMGSTNLAKLTDEDKAIATNKGWTLA